MEQRLSETSKRLQNKTVIRINELGSLEMSGGIVETLRKERKVLTSKFEEVVFREEISLANKSKA